MKVDLNGMVAVITGAGGALGQAMALRFAENGAKVAVCDINEPGGRKTVELITQAGGSARFYRHDVSSSKDSQIVMQAIHDELGNISILINNAGVNVPPDKRTFIDNFDDAMWDWIVRIDLDGVFKCSKAAIPHIGKNGGSIINISSIVGLVPLRNQCAFAAAKAGVINLSKAMALELGEKNIRVNAIAPGSIVMEGTKALIYNDPVRAEDMLSHIPLHRAGKPDDIAYAALYLASNEASYVNGSVLTVDGGWTCSYARNF